MDGMSLLQMAVGLGRVADMAKTGRPKAELI